MYDDYEENQRREIAEEKYDEELEEMMGDIHNVVNDVADLCPDLVRFRGLRMSELAELTLRFMNLGGEAEEAFKQFCDERYMTKLEEEWR